MRKPCQERPRRGLRSKLKLCQLVNFAETSVKGFIDPFVVTFENILLSEITNDFG